MCSCFGRRFALVFPHGDGYEIHNAHLDRHLNRNLIQFKPCLLSSARSHFLFSFNVRAASAHPLIVPPQRLKQRCWIALIVPLNLTENCMIRLPFKCPGSVCVCLCVWTLSLIDLKPRLNITRAHTHTLCNARMDVWQVLEMDLTVRIKAVMGWLLHSNHQFNSLLPSVRSNSPHTFARTRTLQLNILAVCYRLVEL